MAYSPITDGEIDTDSALTTTLMRKYRDNFLAVINGESGAPRIPVAALNGFLKPQVYPFSGLADTAASASRFVADRVGVLDIDTDFTFDGDAGEDGTVKIQGSNDDAAWTDIATFNWTIPGASGDSGSTTVTSGAELSQPDGDTVYLYYRVFIDGDGDVSFDGTWTVRLWGGEEP